MKTTYLISILLFISVSANAQRFEWLNNSETSTSCDYRSVAKSDAAGNVLVTGLFTGDLIIEDDTIHDPGNTYYYLVKLNASGKHLWSKWFKLGNGSFSDMCVDMSGNIYVSVLQNNFATYIDADTSFAVVAPVNWVVSFDSNGALRWIIGGFIQGFLPLAASTTEPGFFIGNGGTVQHFDSDGTLIWSSSISSGSMVINGLDYNNLNRLAATARTLSNGTVMFDTVSVSSDNASNDQLVFQLDTSGSVLWGRNIPYASTSSNSSIAVGVSSTGDVYVLFNSGGALPQLIFANDTLTNPYGLGILFGGVLKFSSSGTPQWAKGNFYSNTGAAEYFDMIINNNDEVIVCGSYQGALPQFDNLLLYPAIGNPTSMVAKLDANGIAIWTKQDIRISTSYYDEAYSLSKGFNNSYNVSGFRFGSGAFYMGCNFSFFPTYSKGHYFTNISEQSDTVPVAAFNFSYNGFTYMFNDSSQNATSWHWDFGNGDTSGLQSPVYTYPLAGSYTVTLTVYFGNCASSATQQLVNVSVEERNLHGNVEVYPNPADEFVLCSFSLSSASVVEFSVFDPTGRLVSFVKKEKFTYGRHVEKIETSNLSSGIYYLKLSIDNYYSVRKIIQR